jgi:hypothetical protein
MKRARREFLHLLVGAAAVPPVAGVAWGQSYRADTHDRRAGCLQFSRHHCSAIRPVAL